MQHVRGPTHQAGQALDLVLTFSACQLQSVTAAPPGVISDHSLVTCRLPEVVHSSEVAERWVRSWQKVDCSRLCCLLKKSELSRPADVAHDVDQLFRTYESVLGNVADQLAPSHVVKRRLKRIAPWFDDDCRLCRTIRRNCRRLERRYRLSLSPDDRSLWVEATWKRFQAYRVKRDEYWLYRLQQCGRSSGHLWRSLSSVLGRDCDVSRTTRYTADQFAAFFAQKINGVRKATTGLLAPTVRLTTMSSFTAFEECTPADVRRLIMNSPVKWCSLDPVPTFLVREFVDVLFTLCHRYGQRVFDSRSSNLPTSQKHAVVTPLLKKTGLDPSDLSNYRPVSNLTFM